MDILRLTLERSTSSKEALKILTKLHEDYNQGTILFLKKRKISFNKEETAIIFIIFIIIILI